MHFPKFWKKAEEGGVLAWGWSDSSADEAMANAAARARRVREWLNGERAPGANTYGYPELPLREEALREFQDADGQASPAVVTRNRMGCLVLNATNLMFVDVDQPEASNKGRGLLSLLFGRGKTAPVEDPLLVKIQAAVEAWLQGHPGWGWRVYRTKAGVRLMATHQPVEAKEGVVTEAFAAFEADPLYRNLCARQECFRARLTAKPWRCGVPRLRVLWPWGDEKIEGKFRAWEERYLKAAKDYATCKLIGQFGAQEIHPALRELVEFHDKATRVDTDMPLA